MNNNWENINKLINYSPGGILSKAIVKNSQKDITLFCLAAGTELSEHTSTKEGIVYIIEGQGIFNLEGEEIEMKAGIFIKMPKNARHSLKAEKNTSFLLFLFS